MSVSSANIALWKLMDDTMAQDAPDYRVTCDDCAVLISEDQYGEHDGLCDRCYDAAHFTCGECGKEFHCDDVSSDYPELCTDCGSTKRTEVADALWSEIEDLADSWSGEDTEIPNLKKLLAYAKKLSK